MQDLSLFAREVSRWLVLESIKRMSRLLQSTTRLVGLQQKSSESLNAFMGQFNTKIEKIKNLDSIVALHVMIVGRRPEPFSDSLPRRQSSTIDELWRLAVGYINMEELVATKIQGTTEKNKGKAPARESQLKKVEKGAQDTKTQKGRFTPLPLGEEGSS